jgi:hypothetical protein
LTENNVKEQMEEFEEKSFFEMLYKMFKEINPKDSMQITKERKGAIGKARDHAMLFLKSFQQVSPFMTIFFLMLALPDRMANNVSSIFNLFGIDITISGTAIGILSVVFVVIVTSFGYIMLVYGGTQRSQNLITTSQGPNPRLDFHAYQVMMKWMLKHQEDLEELREDLDDMRNQSS